MRARMIGLSKRFLTVLALLILVAGSSAAMVPVRAQGDSKIVYVAICVDTEYMGGSSQWMGSADPHPTLNVSEYSRTVPMTVAAVFDSDFRNSHRDSFGNIFKMSWFAEMDYLIAQSNFVWADGSPAGVSGYTATRDLLVNNWGTEIQTYGDSVEYHHHFVIFDGTWKRYDSGPDAGYPDYQMYALDHMIIDRNFYPSTWRSGWWIMPPALSSWLEQWMPFDYTPESGIWYPVHPSGMDRWQTKCPYAPNVPSDVNSAFAYASEHGSAVFSLCTHDQDNMKSQVSGLHYCLNTADADEAAYPNVSFKYVSAREAMQRALGFTDFTPPTFTVTSSDNTYTIVSSEPLWKNHPYIALKYTNGTYSHMSATPTGTNTWTVTPPTSVSAIGVAGSDLYGNPGTATFTQDHYALTVGTVGSGSVTKSPDQATYASGTVVTLTAVPSAGWSFNGWSGDLVGTDNPATITMNGDKTVTATFSQNEYTLTINVVGQGSVSKEPDQAAYIYDTTVQLTATPQVDWGFSHWGGDLSGSSNPATITMTGDRNVTATFTQDQYTLTVNVVGGGSVAKDPDQAIYAYGASVQLTAIPALGWSFAGWSGDLSGSTNPTTIVMDGSKTVDATFTEDHYTLTVTIAGSGAVSKDPEQATYTYGTSVELTATPSTGWSFLSWSGDATGSGNPITIIMTGNKSVTATFTEDEYARAQDGYESGDFSAWTGTIGNPQVVSSEAHHGTYSMEVDTGNEGSYKTISTITTCYERAYFKYTGTPPTYSFFVTVLYLRYNNDLICLVGLRQNTAGDFRVRLLYLVPSFTTVDSSAVSWATDEWHSLEVKFVCHASAGEYRVYYDGDEVITQTGLDTSDVSGVNHVRGAGYWVGGTDPKLYVDCVAIDNEYIGQEAEGYALTVGTVGSGSVTKSPDQATYASGTVVTLTAVPSAGWSFNGWSGDLVGSDNPATITMNGDKTVTATFSQNEYTLTIDVVGQGSVSKEPDQAAYIYDTTVQLTATPALGWSFAGWSGDLSGSTNPTTIVMDGSKTVNATFTEDQYALTINTVGSGSVSKNPDQATYVYGDTVVLTANPTLGWSFSIWSGDLGGNTNPATIIMDGNKIVTATFTENQYTLTINTVGSGSVSKIPDQATYVYGTSVELTATSNLGWSFSQWTGDLTGSVNPATITITGNMVITATFTEDQYTLSITTTGDGTVTKTPDLPTYSYGSVVTLTATPNLGYSFSGWSGDLIDSENPTTITMTSDKSVTALFTQNHYTLTVSTVGSGSVTKVPEQATYTYGTSVELTAVPALGWSFAGWSGHLSGSQSPVDLVMDDNKIVTATFIQNEYTLDVSIVGSGSVAKAPDQSTYHYNDVVELTAAPNAGWSFGGWSVGLVGNPTSVTITGDLTVTATFTQIEYSLTVNISPVDGGSVSKNPDSPHYHYNDVVQLTATPALGYSFAGWSDGLTGNPTSVTITDNTVVTATFTQLQYMLTTNVVGSGSVTQSPDPPYTYGNEVTLTAVPATGWSFSGWSGALSGTDNPAYLTMDGDKTVTATFTQNQYILTVNILGQGTVTKDPNQTTYTYGSMVQLAATADVGYAFSGWSGDLTGSTNPTTITMDSSKTITATFSQNQYTLTFTIVGTGTITKSPDQATYTHGTTVTLTATAGLGWTFTGWSGDLSGSQSPVDIVMDANKAVTATFIQDQYTLSVTTVGNGVVIKVPDQAFYNYGDVVQLTADSDDGWSFAGWSGDLSGSNNPESITMTGSKSVTATFTQNVYTLTVTTVGSGTVNLNNSGPYYYGDIVELTAVSSTGWSFDHWAGDLSGSANPTTILINGDKTVTATFTQNEYTLTVNIAGSGSVTKSPDQQTYHYSDVVQLTAMPNLGYSFSGWSGDLTGTTNPASIIMDSGKTVIATFTEDHYTLTVTIAGSGSVSKDPEQATYTYGTSVELTATPSTGWSFLSWSGDATGSGNPITIIMTGDKSVTATFTEDEYSLTVSASPVEGGSVTRNPDEITYHYNDVVELTATAAAGYSFTGWSGGLTGNPTSVTITGDTAVTAYFTPIEYTLDVTIVGSGSVSKNPDQATYHLNDLVELTAAADSGWSFSGWSGDMSGSLNPSDLTISGNMSVTATFIQDVYSITASVIGVGGTIDPSGIVSVVAGGSQSFTIEADPGYVIADVVVDGVSQGAIPEYTFNAVAMDHSIVASFRQGTYIITASVDGVGGTIDPSGAVSVNGGDTITFTITPESGYHVLNVMVDGTYMGPQNSFTFYEVDRDHTITAIFARNEYSLTIIIVGPGHVTTNPNKISYSHGDIVELTAIPNNKNFQFAYWSGDLTGNTNPATIIMDGSKTVTATFTKKDKLSGGSSSAPAYARASQIAVSRGSPSPQEYFLPFLLWVAVLLLNARALRLDRFARTLTSASKKFKIRK